MVYILSNPKPIIHFQTVFMSNYYDNLKEGRFTIKKQMFIFSKNYTGSSFAGGYLNKKWILLIQYRNRFNI